MFLYTFYFMDRTSTYLFGFINIRKEYRFTLFHVQYLQLQLLKMKIILLKNRKSHYE